VVGVRVGSETDAEGLRRTLVRHARDDVDPQANFSIRLAEPASPRGVTPLHQVYRGGVLVERSRDRGAAVDALLARLGELQVDDTAVLRVRAVAVLDGEQASLVPRRTLDLVPALEPNLRRQGRVVVPGRAVSLDPATLEVLWPPPVEVDVEGYRQLTRRPAAPPPARPARARLRRWVLPDQVLPASRGAVVLRCLTFVENRRAVGGRRALDAAVTAADQVLAAPEATVSAWLDVL